MLSVHNKIIKNGMMWRNASTAALAIGFGLLCTGGQEASAQTAGGATLPSVTVDAPAPRKKAVPKPKPAEVSRPSPKRAAVVPTRQRVVRRQVSPAVAPVVRTAQPALPVPPTQSAPLSADSRAVGPVTNYVPRTSETGTKTATPLIETPSSVSVIGAEQIRDREARTVGEATRYTSGVLGEQFGNDTRNDFIQVRGFNVQITGFFLDGLQLASPGFGTFKLEPFNLERLEVLKGPASVLYGGASTGGIINGVSKRPPDVFGGYVEGGIDNYGNAYTHFDVGGPSVVDPRFLYRVEGVARGGGTQTDFTPDARLSIAPSLTFRPDAATSITFLGSYQKDRTRGENFEPYIGSVVPAPFGRIPTTLFTSDPGLDTFQRNQALIGYALEHSFNDTFTVRQNLRYSDLRINDRTVFGLGYDGDPANANLARLNFNTTPHLTEFAVDTQGEARFRTGPVSHDILAGVDYKRFNFSDMEGFAGGTDFNFLRPVYFNNAPIGVTGIDNFNTQDQIGEYLQEQARFNHFTLVLSGRHDTLIENLNNAVTPSASGGFTKDALTGRVGLIYTTDTGVAPYATYATSFDPQIGTINGNGALQQPERGQLVEVGVKYQPVGTNLSFSGALFNLTEQNVPTASAANPFFTIQVGEERSRGFELEAQGKLTDGLKVLASFTGFQLRDTSDLNTAFIGKVPVAAPQSFGSLFLDYTFQSTVLKGFGGGAGLRYIGGSFASQDNSFGIPSNVLADFALHYEREHWRAAINLTNAFDKTFVSTCSSVNACFYGQRSRALFSLAYKW